MKNNLYYGKRRGCCPGGKSPRLNEGYSSISEIVEDVKNESVYNKAMKKLLNENKTANQYVFKEPNRSAACKRRLAENVNRALNENSKSLYGDKVVCGKKINEMSDIVLTSFLHSLREQNNRAGLRLRNAIFESDDEKASIKDSIVRRLKNIRTIEEELSYRQSRKKFLNESEDEKEEKDDEKEESKGDDSTSEENLEKLFGPGQGSEDEPSAEDDGAEEVELSKIVITMATVEDAEELKQHCMDAGIPEEAMDIVTGDEDEDDDIEEEEPVEGEESENEGDEDEESDDEEKNESVRYGREFRRLYEDGEEDDEPAEDDEEVEDGEEGDDADEEEPATDEPAKFVLVDTDYAPQLAKVLDDVYGYTIDEFNEELGGELVTDEDAEDDSTEDVEEESDDEEKGKDDEGEGDDEEINVGDLFKGL